MEWLNEYHLSGLLIGICTFLIIGLFHPVVVKAEYYWGTKCWWIFLILGIAGVAASLSTDNILVSSLLGVFAFSYFFSRKRRIIKINLYICLLFDNNWNLHLLLWKK